MSCVCELLIGEIWKEFLKVDSLYDWPVSQKGDRFLSLVALVNHIKGAEDYLQRRKNCFQRNRLAGVLGLHSYLEFHPQYLRPY